MTLLEVKSHTGYELKVDQDQKAFVIFARSPELKEWLPVYEADSYNQAIVFINYTLARYLSSGFLG